MQRSDDGEWLRCSCSSSEPHDRRIPTSQATLSSTSMSVGWTSRRKRCMCGTGQRWCSNPDDDRCAGNPDPLGTFFVNDHVAGSGSYGPHILSLSAYSESLETFNGGVPVVAIHGTNRPDLIDGAHSNGCVQASPMTSSPNSRHVAGRNAGADRPDLTAVARNRHDARQHKAVLEATKPIIDSFSPRPAGGHTR